MPELPIGFDFSPIKPGTDDYRIASDRLECIKGLDYGLRNGMEVEVDIIELTFRIKDGDAYLIAGQSDSIEGLFRAAIHAYSTLLIDGISVMMGVHDGSKLPKQ